MSGLGSLGAFGEENMGRTERRKVIVLGVDAAAFATEVLLAGGSSSCSYTTFALRSTAVLSIMATRSAPEPQL